jgi:Family of unknown function (DUF5343)
LAQLPYITAPGNIERALTAIQSAATPPRVNQDFVKTILKIPGGSGNQVTSFLKKIGFANQDGTPSDIYKRFRNTATAGNAAAQALKIGYAPLYTRNEYMHQLTDEKLKGLIIEETGQESDSNVVSLILRCIKAIKKYANWSEAVTDAPDKSISTPVSQLPTQIEQSARSGAKEVGLNLSYTINLNLPATSDVAVFNAIFKSLRENLLKDE